MNKSKINIFVSYSSDPDEQPFFEIFIKGLCTHLFTSSAYDFGVWDESKALPGSSWDKEIQKRLAEADLAILCVSAGFLGSDKNKISEFEALLKKHTDTVIIPVYFNHCNFTVWEDLAGIQFFKPTGEKYGKGPDEDFAFCDMVELSTNNGKHIAPPDAKRDRYFRDFAAKVEEVLAARPVMGNVQPLSPGNDASHYINPDNYPYFEKDNFFGREDLLKEIDDKLKKLDLPLLISGIGGMGKTAVAVAYGKDPIYHPAYQHIAWINVTDNIFSNLFSTFQGNAVIPFEYSTDGDRQKDSKNIMQLLTKVPGQNLLLIDNANEEKELQEFIEAWKKYMPGWKCIITTRSENSAYRKHLIQLQVISPEAAAELFKTHNTEDFDDNSFKAIYEYIGGHTFLIELLAKYGQESSLVNGTKEILTYLKSKGIKALNRAVLAGRGQQEKTDKLVSEFVMGLYDPLTLKENEKECLRYFSVLTAADFEFLTLVRLFGIPEEEKDNFDNTLNILYKKGWLIHSGSTFKCHQIIQEICKEKLKPDADNCDTLIKGLSDLFKKTSTTEAIPFFETGLSVINNIQDTSFGYALMQVHLSVRIAETGNFLDALNLLQLARQIFINLNKKTNEYSCLERMGVIYRTQGKRLEALNCFQQCNLLRKDLSDRNPDNIKLKHSLAISYRNLGDLYRDEGSRDEALNCYLADMRLLKELSDLDPENINFKHSLAISYSRLGNLNSDEGNWKKALNFFEQYNILGKELSDKYPSKVKFKYSLATSYGKLGDLYRSYGNKSGALSCFRLYNNLKKEVSEQNPDNVKFKHGLAISYCKLGDVCRDEGDREEAFLCFHQYNILAKELSYNNPDYVALKNSLAISYERLGNLHRDNGRTDMAQDCFLQFYTLEKEVYSQNPDNVVYRNNLAIAFSKLASVSSPEQARKYSISAKKIWEELVKKVPQNVKYKANLNWITSKLNGS